MYILLDIVNIRMTFEWNEEKNKKNFVKHGVWFEEAQTLWVDENSVEFFDPDHGKSEERFIRVGYSLKTDCFW